MNRLNKVWSEADYWFFYNHWAIYIDRDSMIDNEEQNNPAALFNTFKLSLTREQQKALAILMPQNYSFQPSKITRSID